MSSHLPFTPAIGSVQSSFAVTSTSSQINLLPSDPHQIYLANVGSVAVFMGVGSAPSGFGAGTAGSNLALAVNFPVVLSINASVITVATTAGSSLLNMVKGEGVL